MIEWILKLWKKIKEKIFGPEPVGLGGIEGSVFSIRLGMPGSGKSLGLVEEDLLPHLLAGEEVWCNFWINWKGENLHFFSADEFEDLAPKLRNCVLIMDEIGQVMEPRAWEQESGNVRRFFQLHRHHHVDIYGTTQDVSLVAKSAWIVVDEWIMCHKLENSAINRIVDWVLGRYTFRVGYQDMTYQELKKMAAGWENSETDENGVGGDIRVVVYDEKKLIHEELDDKKVELKHWRCNKCNGRQEIMKEEQRKELTSKELIPAGSNRCPKHWADQEMEEELSGMYDSDYDLPITEKEVIFIPYKKTEVMRPFKGALSDRQVQIKANKEKNF